METFSRCFAHNFIERDSKRQQATLSGATRDCSDEAEAGGFGRSPRKRQSTSSPLKVLWAWCPLPGQLLWNLGVYEQWVRPEEVSRSCRPADPRRAGAGARATFRPCRAFRRRGGRGFPEHAPGPTAPKTASPCSGNVQPSVLTISLFA